MDDLYSIPLFEGITSAELDWLIANSREVRLQRGDYFSREGEPTEFYVTLEGELQVSTVEDGQEEIWGTTPRGVIGGENALLSMRPSHVNTRAIMDSRLMVFDKSSFRLIFAHVPVVGARILEIANARLKTNAAFDMEEEKLLALARLSAGLAHELNNPASAARRATNIFRAALRDLQTATVRLTRIGLTSEQMLKLIEYQHQAITASRQEVRLSPLERADREAAVVDWLELLRVNRSWEMAATFVGAGFTLADLQKLVTKLDCIAPSELLIWFCNSLAIAGLVDEIERSAHRMSDIVDAVKGYTFMDETPYQEIDIHSGIENTLIVLGSRLSSVTVEREFDSHLPRMMARGSALNQLWTHLLENAIDATGDNGLIRVITRAENDHVMVEVADNGVGIPPDVMPRIFEPFFTTKQTTMHTGLGLDSVCRIVEDHHGTIDVQLDNGLTRFIIRLPVGHRLSVTQD